MCGTATAQPAVGFSAPCKSRFFFSPPWQGGAGGVAAEDNEPPPAPPFQGGEKNGRHRFAERHMGTLFQITIVGDEATAQAAAAKAFAKAKELDEKLSDY